MRKIEPAGHVQVPILIGEQEVFVDEGIAPFLSALNAAGVRTRYSCQGDIDVITGDSEPEADEDWVDDPLRLRLVRRHDVARALGEG